MDGDAAFRARARGRRAAPGQAGAARAPGFRGPGLPGLAQLPAAPRPHLRSQCQPGAAHARPAGHRCARLRALGRVPLGAALPAGTGDLGHPARRHHHHPSVGGAGLPDPAYRHRRHPAKHPGDPVAAGERLYGVQPLRREMASVGRIAHLPPAAPDADLRNRGARHTIGAGAAFGQGKRGGRLRHRRQGPRRHGRAGAARLPAGRHRGPRDQYGHPRDRHHQPRADDRRAPRAGGAPQPASGQDQDPAAAGRHRRRALSGQLRPRHRHRRPAGTLRSGAGPGPAAGCRFRQDHPGHGRGRLDRAGRVPDHHAVSAGQAGPARPQRARRRWSPCWARPPTASSSAGC